MKLSLLIIPAILASVDPAKLTITMMEDIQFDVATSTVLLLLVRKMGWKTVLSAMLQDLKILSNLKDIAKLLHRDRSPFPLILVGPIMAADAMMKERSSHDKKKAEIIEALQNDVDVKQVLGLYDRNSAFTDFIESHRAEISAGDKHISPFFWTIGLHSLRVPVPMNNFTPEIMAWYWEFRGGLFVTLLTKLANNVATRFDWMIFSRMWKFVLIRFFPFRNLIRQLAEATDAHTAALATSLKALSDWAGEILTKAEKSFPTTISFSPTIKWDAPLPEGFLFLQELEA